MLEYSWTPEPRGRAEILEAEELFYYQVWYNRHQILRELIKEGKITLVDKFDISEQSPSHRTMEKNIWKGALKAAREVERRFGKKKLGPWTDFEWGMINGKLSALRWTLGDDWDMLDT